MTEANRCDVVQENIAWGKSLSEIDQKHVLTCLKCQCIALEFEEVDSTIKNISADIPDGFADRVMSRVATLEDKSNHSSIVEFFMELFHNQFFRWGLGGTSFLLAFAAH